MPNSWLPGPNHKDNCDGTNFRYSGSGYDRVRICACGAEDHAPSFDDDVPTTREIDEDMERMLLPDKRDTPLWVNVIACIMILAYLLLALFA